MWHTERLTIRQFRLDDWADLYQLQGDPEATRFIGGVWSEEEAREVTERIATPSSDPWEWLAVADRVTDQLLGVGWLGPLNPKWCHAMGWDDAPIEIGYRYARQHWGKGYATEAAESMLRRGFEELGLSRIVAVVDVRNVASERVLQKLGMSCVGSGTHDNITIRGYELRRDSEDTRS